MDVSKYTRRWSLVVECSIRRLKSVLVHNGHKYGSIPISNSTKMTEELKIIPLIQHYVSCHAYQYLTCMNLKRVNFLLCQQSGFANGPGDLGSLPGRVIPKTKKMVLDASLLNTQHYKVWIKGKVEQSRGRSSALPYTLV